MTTNRANPNELVVCADKKLRPRWASRSNLCWQYFDHEWGRPPTDLNALLEILILVVFQVGVTWHAVLVKREGLKAAFADFDVATVAAFDERDIERLLEDPRIFRNRRKITAAITNAKAFLALTETKGSLDTIIADSVRDPGDIVKELKQLGFTHIGPTSLSILRQAIGVGDLKAA
ncbi:DNA-3-methyladenine glycosylase I [Corynebacterium suranareeae]|nr:DNA-3-methyladenine glycosylase I [Corynebacterium suranareeae]